MKIQLLIVIIELSYLGGDLADLPSLQSIFGVKDLSVLLLELPQFRVNVESSAKVGLPLFVSVLRQVSKKHP